MLNITFQGAPFLFVGESLEESAPIATVEHFVNGDVSFAHYWPDGCGGGVVRRHADIIGTRADIVVVGPAAPIEMTVDEVARALENMLNGVLSGDWFRGRREAGRS